MDHSTAPRPHPVAEERPCACYGGLVFVGHLVEDPETGEEAEAFEPYPCRRCGGL